MWREIRLERSRLVGDDEGGTQNALSLAQKSRQPQRMGCRHRIQET
jgi:hypothetical protein